MCNDSLKCNCVIRVQTTQQQKQRIIHTQIDNQNALKLNSDLY